MSMITALFSPRSRRMTRMNRIAAVLATFAALTTYAQAAEVRVLSAGAVEPGLHRFAELVKRETGHELRVQFNTAPQIAKRLADSDVYDLLISPPAVISQAVKDGKVDASTRVPVGRVGVGIVVRANALAPTVATVDQFQTALLASESVVYNTASTGLYLDKLFEKIGVLDQIKPKTTRYPDGASVMEHIIKSKGTVIGFGAITEVRMYEPRTHRLRPWIRRRVRRRYVLGAGRTLPRGAIAPAYS